MPMQSTSFATRRDFIRGTLGSLTVLSSSPLSAEAGSSTWALAGDTHVDANPAAVARGVNMSDNLRSVVAQVVAEPGGVGALFVDGDCAYLQGLPGDYVQLRSLLEPLGQAGIEVHMALGNHDHRENFRQVFAAGEGDGEPVSGKHIEVIRTPLVNWFVLDSLLEVNKVTGNLGEAQLAWLNKVLDEFPDQPAILLGHHNPQLKPGVGKNGASLFTGLSDTGAFFDLLHRKPQVQAYVFGHSHNWAVSKTDRGLHLVNLPPTAYVFDPSRPNGWVKACVDQQGFHLELRSLNPAHSDHGKKVTLAWR